MSLFCLAWILGVQPTLIYHSDVSILHFYMIWCWKWVFVWNIREDGPFLIELFYPSIKNKNFCPYFEILVCGSLYFAWNFVPISLGFKPVNLVYAEAAPLTELWRWLAVATKACKVIPVFIGLFFINNLIFLMDTSAAPLCAGI